MRSARCTLCQRPVLEVRGQFEILDSLYLAQESPLSDSVGIWHTPCLRSTPYGAAWHEVRLRSFTQIRRHPIIATEGEWTIIEQSLTEAPLALSAHGDLLALGFSATRARRVAGGRVYGVVEPDYNLHLDDAAVIREVVDALGSTGSFALLALFEALEIADRVSHPEALEGSVLRVDHRRLRPWTRHCVAARWEYGVFVPDALVKYVRQR
jgi:hypothetical protein